VQAEQVASFDWRSLGRSPANDNRAARPRVHIDSIGPDDVRRVRETFRAKLSAVLPRIGRLSRLRDFAVNLVRLFEMLVEPGFAVPWRTTAAIVFALAYFISSVDLIPDTIPVVGFVDDAFVVAEVMVMIAGDVARFDEHRRNRRAPARPLAQTA
jgi:uncharacterized membrane protein YkvA (DUF1232 family)